MTEHLPILQVIIPLLAAPLCLIVGRAKPAWFFTLIVTGLTSIISLNLLASVLGSGEIIYTLGGWSAPIGIEYRIDELNAYLLVLVSVIGFITLIAAEKSLEKELSPDRHVFFYVAYLLALAGLLGILATGDAFNIFVFLEISSLSSYTLIAIGKDRRALWASYQYLIMGTIGATFILIGIGLIYMMTGTLNIHDLAEKLPAVEETKTVYTAFAFFMVGVALKLALFPLHLWLPNAYAYAPSIVTTFLAATATKVSIYVMIRFVFGIFGLQFSLSHLPLQEIFITLGIAGIFFASIVAIYQNNVKKLFAYSSVAQVGYIILAFSIGSPEGLTASLIHIFNHALMKSAIFLAIAGIVYRLGNSHILSIYGIGKTMPLTTAAIIIGGFSLIGIPLTAGFISKWYLVIALLNAQLTYLVPLVLISSLLAVVYVWRIVEAAYFKPASEAAQQATEAPLLILIPTWILVIANIYFGINTELTAGVSQIAANALFTGGP